MYNTLVILFSINLDFLSLQQQTGLVKGQRTFHKSYKGAHCNYVFSMILKQNWTSSNMLKNN